MPITHCSEAKMHVVMNFRLENLIKVSNQFSPHHGDFDAFEITMVLSLTHEIRLERQSFAAT